MVELNSGRFVVTRKGQKTGVLLSIKEYNELLEDLADLATIAERKEEPSEPFGRVKERLEHKWLNTGSK
jgi:PHD/YefM family antitoxin component YafN of YafNO toxin-antitoxin module